MAIPKKVLDNILSDEYYKKCARGQENCCHGRVTFEHVFIYAGKQVQEKWAIIPLCEYHHDVLNYQDNGDLNKELNMLIALNRATDEELRAVSKAVNYISRRNYLRDKYPDYA